MFKNAKTENDLPLPTKTCIGLMHDRQAPDLDPNKTDWNGGVRMEVLSNLSHEKTNILPYLDSPHAKYTMNTNPILIEKTK